MERVKREELKALSKELLGSSSKYQKLLKGVLVDTNETMANGKSIKSVKRMGEDELLSMLRDMKKEKEEKALSEKVQKSAGGSVVG
jgi:hypothetical protein